MPNHPPKLGHINFRLAPELHQELLEIARALGTDLSGLLKVMIKDALPAYSARAAEAVTRQRTSLANRVELLLGLISEPDPFGDWTPPPTWAASWCEQLQHLRELRERTDRERAERDEREEQARTGLGRNDAFGTARSLLEHPSPTPTTNRPSFR